MRLGAALASICAVGLPCPASLARRALSARAMALRLAQLFMICSNAAVSPEITLQQLVDRGLRLRLWCFTCARGSTLDAVPIAEKFVQRQWPLALGPAAARFCCKRCRSSANVLLLPASPPPPEPPPRQLSWDEEVVAFFHAMRAERKRKASKVWTPPVDLSRWTNSR